MKYSFQVADNSYFEMRLNLDPLIFELLNAQ